MKSEPEKAGYAYSNIYVAIGVKIVKVAMGVGV